MCSERGSGGRASGSASGGGGDMVVAWEEGRGTKSGGRGYGHVVWRMGMGERSWKRSCAIGWTVRGSEGVEAGGAMVSRLQCGCEVGPGYRWCWDGEVVWARTTWLGLVKRNNVGVSFFLVESRSVD